MPQYKYLFKDDAQTTLATGITAASSSLQVVSGGGSLFPVLGANQAFVATLIKSGNPAIKEVVLVTGHPVGDNMTGLTRNLSGTGALTWNAGDTFAMLQPAEMMAVSAQIIDLQSQATNYSVDTGAPNIFQVAPNPPLNAHVIGMPIRFKAAHTNTNTICTFNDGISTAPLVTPQGTGIPLGSVLSGGIYEAIWDGTNFELVSNPSYSFAQISGSVSNAQVPQSAVLQWESSFVIAFSQLTGQLFQSQVPNNLNLPGVPTAPTAAIGTSSAQLVTAAFVNPSSVLGSYRKSPDGNIDQWGLCNPNGGTITVIFPVAFPAACDNLVFGQISGGPTQVYSPTGTVSRIGFQVANTGGQTYWRARGH